VVVKDEPAREVAKRLKEAGFVRVSTDGRHANWRHPSGVWVPVPERHRMISAGVVRKINKAIEESEGK
jgi:predicted RNA binding protein YcfA (HicA-like mRNA interferase family)